MKATIWKSEENMRKVQKMYEQIAIIYTLDKSIYSKLADRLHKLEKEVEEKTTETDFLIDTTIAAIYLELDSFMKNKGNALLEKRQKEALKEQLCNMFDILNSDNMEEIQDKLMDEYLELAKEHNITDIICELQLAIIKLHYREYKTISVMQRVEPYKEIFMSFMAKKVTEFLSNKEMPELDKKKLSLSIISSSEGSVCNYLSPQIMMFFVAQGEERDMMCKDELVIKPLPPHDPKLYSKEIQEKLDELDQKYEECKNKEFSCFEADMLKNRHFLDKIEKGETVEFNFLSQTIYKKCGYIFAGIIYRQVPIYSDIRIDNYGIFIDGKYYFSFYSNTPTYFKQMMYIYLKEKKWYWRSDKEVVFYREMWRLCQMEIKESERFKSLENDYYADQELLQIYSEEIAKYYDNPKNISVDDWIARWLKRRGNIVLKIIRKRIQAGFKRNNVMEKDRKMMDVPLSFKFPEFYHSDLALTRHRTLLGYFNCVGENISKIADYLSLKKSLEETLNFDEFEYRKEAKIKEAKFNKEKIEKVNAIVAEKKKLLKDQVSIAS